ncbi:MAG: hypothetical protein LLF76_09370 [Planctomycetaceae bacterium]|nr:hypothetical protein [Planctomycetaceae bacterium]
MKEIDFIPDWYRADQNRKRRYHYQYALLAILLTVLTAWNFVLGHHVQRVRAEADATQAIIEAARQRIDESLTLQNNIDEVSHKTSELEAVVPRTRTSAILAELSYVAGENIIFRDLKLQLEPVNAGSAPSAVNAQAIVKVASAETAQAAQPVPVRIQVVLGGVAARPADAAALIYRLEQSAYFEQVVPAFTRAGKLGERDVTEFEIRCYVADYRLGRSNEASR